MSGTECVWIFVYLEYFLARSVYEYLDIRIFGYLEHYLARSAYEYLDIRIFGYLEHYLARSAYESLDIWNIIWLEVRVMSVWDFDFESGANIFWCLSDWDFNSRIISSSHLLTRRINWVRDDFTKIPKRGRPLCPGHWACQWEIKFMHRWHLALFKQAFGAPY